MGWMPDSTKPLTLNPEPWTKNSLGYVDGKYHLRYTYFGAIVRLHVYLITCFLFSSYFSFLIYFHMLSFENRLAPFPGQMLYKATKPELFSCLSFFHVIVYNACLYVYILIVT